MSPVSETAFARKDIDSAAVSVATADKVCWIEVKSYPYQPDHQVELLHLQAEADALIIKLQTARSRHSSQHQA
ncbi:MAG: hypothetical protein WA783_08925 [Phormidesmis sp.]